MSTKAQYPFPPFLKYFEVLVLVLVIFLSGCNGDENDTSNEEPTISNQDFDVSEHSVSGTVIGTIAAIDPDGDDLSFTISSGNTEDYFEIDQSTGELTVGSGGVNFETQNLHELDVSVSDGKTEVTAEILVRVTDIDECEAGLCPSYLDMIYAESDVTISTGLNYGTSPALKYDFYSVEINYDPSRPVVIVFPYAQVNNPNAAVPALEGHCKDLARRGYAVALAYQSDPLGGDTFKEDVTSYIDQVHGQKAAIRHFRKEAESMRLDEHNIFLSGWVDASIAALMTAHLELEDIDEMIDGSTEFQEVYDEMGFDGTENLGFDSDIRGVTLMTIFASDLAIIDEGGPAMMIIHHEDTELSDGTVMMGAYTFDNDIYTTTLYGPDLIKERAIANGFVEGEDLGYILMNGGDNDPNFNPYFATVTSDNWNDIAAFYHRNLDR